MSAPAGIILGNQRRPAPQESDAYTQLQEGGQYETSVPTVRGRVVQAAAKLVLEPIFEADFAPCSYGFRPKRSAVMAKERLRRGFIEGYQFVVEFDIANFFGEIDHERLLPWLPPPNGPQQLALPRFEQEVPDPTFAEESCSFSRSLTISPTSAAT